MRNSSYAEIDAQGAKNNIPDLAEILQIIGNTYNIDVADMQDKIKMSKRKEILEQHRYEIWQGTNGCWYTYVLDENGERRLKKRASKEKLEDFIVKYYSEAKVSPTVENVFKEWLARKYRNKTIELNTMQRYERQYEQTLSELGRRKIQYITAIDIEDCIYTAIAEKSLTSKGLSNMKTLLNGIFDYARKQGLTNLRIREIIADMDISTKTLRSTYKPDEELVFLEEEVSRLKEYMARRKAANKLDLKDLGLYLLFFTGLRPGELAAIERVADVGKGSIHIKRTEIRYLEGNKYVYEVRDYPKTEAGIRDVIVPREAQWIIDEIVKLNPNGKYLFEQNGIRIKTCCFDSRLEGICKKIGIPKRKSMNKIRKTAASIMRDSNVPDSIVIAQIGHTDIKTTNKYYYKNRNNLEKQRQIIDQIAFVS